MNLFALLLLCGADPLDNFDFSRGTLTSWEVRGQAFRVLPAARGEDGLPGGVISSDRVLPGRTGLLRRVFEVPYGAGEIRFEAFAVQAGAEPKWQGDDRLDVLLAAAGKRILPKKVKEGNGWKIVPRLLAPQNGRPREYCWDVSDHEGRMVQLLIGDADARAGNYVYCSGFRIITRQKLETDAFLGDMTRVADKHHLAPPARFESRHFLALSSAEEKFTRQRLGNCELIYTVFYKHFRAKGFVPREPSARLLVAIFDSHGGFDAYLGGKFSPFIRGLYQPDKNRLVIYDFGDSESFQASRRQSLTNVQKHQGKIDTDRYSATVERLFREYRAESNIDVTMHETAHQLSFNAGMLNRRGDVPMWLAEGLACYCEASDQGAWKGIGVFNRNRQAELDRALSGRNGLIPLRELLASDHWRDHDKAADARLLGYAQSWALFRWLMEQQPRAMRKYLELIYDRQAPDHRLTDFREMFGADLEALERRYQAYLRKLAEEFREAKRDG